MKSRAFEIYGPIFAGRLSPIKGKKAMGVTDKQLDNS